MISAIIRIVINFLLASAALSAPLLDTKAPVDKVPQVMPTSNLAGALYRDAGTFTAVSGVFTIPAFTLNPYFKVSSCSEAVWVGIDGYSCGNVFRVGVGLVYLDGYGIVYAPWYEWDKVRYFAQPIDLGVGDAIKLTVNTSSPIFGTAKIENLTTNQVASIAIQFATPLCQRDAEWMLEVPGDIPDFGNIFISNAFATTPNGNIGPNVDNVMVAVLSANDRYLVPVIDSSNINIHAN